MLLAIFIQKVFGKKIEILESQNGCYENRSLNNLHAALRGTFAPTMYVVF